MECKVSSTRQRSNKLVTIVNEEVTKTKKFRQLGSIIHNNGQVEGRNQQN